MAAINDWFYCGDVFEIVNTKTLVVERTVATRTIAEQMIGRRKQFRIRHLREYRSAKSYGHQMRVEAA